MKKRYGPYAVLAAAAVALAAVGFITFGSHGGGQHKAKAAPKASLAQKGPNAYTVCLAIAETNNASAQATSKILGTWGCAKNPANGFQIAALYLVRAPDGSLHCLSAKMTSAPSGAVRLDSQKTVPPAYCGGQGT